MRTMGRLRTRRYIRGFSGLLTLLYASRNGGEGSSWLGQLATMSTVAAVAAMHTASRASHTAREAGRHTSTKRNSAIMCVLSLSYTAGTRSTMAMSTMHVVGWLSGATGESSRRHSSSHRRHAGGEVAGEFAVERLSAAETGDGKCESEAGECDHLENFVYCKMNSVVVLVYCLLK